MAQRIQFILERKPSNGKQLFGIGFTSITYNNIKSLGSFAWQSIMHWHPRG